MFRTSNMISIDIMKICMFLRHHHIVLVKVTSTWTCLMLEKVSLPGFSRRHFKRQKYLARCKSWFFRRVTASEKVYFLVVVSQLTV